MAALFLAEAQSLRAYPLPLGGAVAQRLRGYKWRSEKSVKALAPTGAALAFLCFDFFFRFVKGEQPLETGCGTQHPLRALGGTRVLLAAAPTTPPCFRRWRRSSSLLLRGGWSPEVGRGESEHPSLPLAQRSVPARCWQAVTSPAQRRALTRFSSALRAVFRALHSARRCAGWLPPARRSPA